MAAPPMPSSPAPTTAIRAKGHPVIGSPPGLGGPDPPARLGLMVGVAGVVGGTEGDGLADPDGEGLGP